MNSAAPPEQLQAIKQTRRDMAKNILKKYIKKEASIYTGAVITPWLRWLHTLDKTDTGELLSLLPSLNFLSIKPSTVATD